MLSYVYVVDIGLKKICSNLVVAFLQPVVLIETLIRKHLV